MRRVETMDAELRTSRGVSPRDTICAVASPPGPGLRGILRVSGPQAADLVERCFRVRPPLGFERGRRALLAGDFDDGGGRQPGLVLWMPGPRSYTGEDVAEFHLPGAPPLLRAANAHLVRLGARPAEPGEFTRRAFHCGRIDLSRAEGVAALVAASGEAERRAALRLLEGGFERRVAAAREALEELRALMEASLDFDEADTGEVPRAELAALAEHAAGALLATRAESVASAGEAGRARVVLLGAPNAGKSALFTALTGRRALVSPLAGTTRDTLSATLRLAGEGVEVELLDLPGLDADAAGLEREAQERAAERLAAADLILWVLDAAAPAAPARPDGIGADAGALLVWNKIDLAAAGPRPPEAFLDAAGAREWIGTSALSGAGLAELGAKVAGLLAERGSAGALGGWGREVAARHRSGLAQADAELQAARAGLAGDLPLDLVATHLTAATDALDALAGRTTAEDLLDRIFARFCLGK